MGLEIERKFLVKSDTWKGQGPGVRYRQGYLSIGPQSVVRVRTMGERAALTIKGAVVGTARPEFEYEIPVEDAEQLLLLCEVPLIEKTRTKIEHEGLVWEVDEFHGANAGLVVAECELESEDQEIAKPDWVGEEVTSEIRYYNASLVKRPFNTW
jgi:adenylate cyclase